MPNSVKTALLLGGMSALLLYLGEALAGPGGLMTGFVAAAVMNLGSYWFSDKIALSMAGAHEVSEAQEPGLHALVADVVDEEVFHASARSAIAVHGVRVAA